MAAGTISKPGDQYGPCLDESCEHTDCAASRKQAATRCNICGEAIGYERLFYQRDNWTILEHAPCKENKRLTRAVDDLQEALADCEENLSL